MQRLSSALSAALPLISSRRPRQHRPVPTEVCRGAPRSADGAAHPWAHLTHWRFASGIRRLALGDDPRSARITEVVRERLRDSTVDCVLSGSLEALQQTTGTIGACIQGAIHSEQSVRGPFSRLRCAGLHELKVDVRVDDCNSCCSRCPANAGHSSVCRCRPPAPPTPMVHGIRFAFVGSAHAGSVGSIVRILAACCAPCGTEHSSSPVAVSMKQERDSPTSLPCSARRFRVPPGSLSRCRRLVA